jgi:hypothetical protein
MGILGVVENIHLPFALAEAEPVVQRFFEPEAWGGDEEPCADVRFVDGESQRERGGEDDAWLDPKVQDQFRFGGDGEFQQADHGDLLLPIVGRFKDWSIFPCRRSRS